MPIGTMRAVQFDRSDLLTTRDYHTRFRGRMRQYDLRADPGRH